MGVRQIGSKALTYIHTMMSKIDSYCEPTMKHKEIGSVLCDDPEECNGRGQEGSLRGREYMYTHS